ncbi:sensor histidine kinase [Adhaeribacter pallidiroseus]|uniref:histidine kinase n=1 Tax=Adhaeribacter pallidiroseus TaxID=2072847 RepID=A0A369QD87_9BACT|nr:histidine kinase [Adhaeribacter pallidiroseus]RDC62871.1 Histidine kinase [Adhaeribacter pallidiroseus]
MQALAGEIQFVIAVTLLILIFTSFVIIFMLIHQRRYHQYLREKEEIRINYQQTILRTQLEVQEQTFRTIAQEIHDNINQVLSLIRLNLSTLKPKLNSISANKINSSKELLDSVSRELRDLSKRLNPEFINRQSLAESLSFQVDLLKKTELYNINLEVHGDVRTLDSEKKLIVFRIAQEALNNIIKHAQATTISVLLMYVPAKIILSIKDDGRGFDLAEVTAEHNPDAGTGTLNMQYRARLIGADFSLHSKPGLGTLVLLVLPND